MQFVSSIVYCIFIAFIQTTSSQSVEYSEKTARQALNLAAAAYSDNPFPCVVQTFPDRGYRIVANEELICDLKGNLCAVFVAVSDNDGKVWISFRGTNSGRQLRREMFQSLKPEFNWYGFGLVDRYFYDAMNYLWPVIAPPLEQSDTSDYDVIFTGHSLGGSLAALATLKTFADGLRPAENIHLFTFGEPRVGNKVLAANIDRIVYDSWRVVHAADIVPHLPPCRNAGPHECDPTDQRRAYHHATEVWYPNGMDHGASYRICTKDNEDPNCSNSLGEWKIKDHYLYFNKMISEYGINGCMIFESNNSRIYSLLSVFSLIILELVF